MNCKKRAKALLYIAKYNTDKKKGPAQLRAGPFTLYESDNYSSTAAWLAANED